MTDQQHLITPPPELVKQWLGEFFGCVVTGQLSDSEKFLATKAANWGADQELEACCKHINQWFAAPKYRIAELRAARRPKPPSLKAQALAIVENLGCCDRLSPKQQAVLNRALEALPDD